MLQPESGKIFLFGQPLTPQLRCHLGYMLQDDQLLEWRSIYKNVILGLEVRHQLNAQTKAYARTLLDNYGLLAFADARPSQLSGGMRQRAALVRTLALKPDLLFLDEPFSALDYQTRLSAGNDIGTIIRSEKKTAILVTHDLSEAVSLADRIIVLSKRPGKIQKIISIDMPKELTPLQRRSADTFKYYFNLIWKELNHEQESFQAGTIPETTAQA